MPGEQRAKRNGIVELTHKQSDVLCKVLGSVVDRTPATLSEAEWGFVIGILAKVERSRDQDPQPLQHYRRALLRRWNVARGRGPEPDRDRTRT